MAERFIRKLERFTLLSGQERTALEALVELPEVVAAHHDIAREGDAAAHVNLLVSGFGARYRLLNDGRRQIVGFVLPDDFCAAGLLALRAWDHSIMAVSDTQVIQIRTEQVVALATSFPGIGRAIWWGTQVEASIAREWIVNVGRRTAYERMAHLFCEIFLRLQAAGMAPADACDMPLTQAELADALGITTVHVNRTLMALRADGLITLVRGRLVVHDLPRLMEAALFDPVYLHLDQAGAALDAAVA